MEMRNYVAPVGEEATREVVIEDEETRLTCGHGYHTRCIIRSLTSSMKCPLCNTVASSDMPDDVRMRIEGRGRILLEDVRKLPEIRAAMRVWRAEKTEFNAMEKEFKRRTKEFKENLRKELGTEDMIKNIYAVPAITNNDDVSRPVSLSISQLVKELGGKTLKHADACRAGALAAKATLGRLRSSCRWKMT
jgi:hypothetical protein